MALAVLLSTALVLLYANMVAADWERCFHSDVLSYSSPPFWNQVSAALSGVIAELMVPRHIWYKLLPLVGPLAMLVIVSPTLRWFAFVVAIVPLIVLQGNGHDCDRKGCVACDFLAMWVLLQTPVLLALISWSLGVGIWTRVRS